MVAGPGFVSDERRRARERAALQGDADQVTFAERGINARSNGEKVEIEVLCPSCRTSLRFDVMDTT